MITLPSTIMGGGGSSFAAASVSSSSIQSCMQLIVKTSNPRLRFSGHNSSSNTLLRATKTVSKRVHYSTATAELFLLNHAGGAAAALRSQQSAFGGSATAQIWRQSASLLLKNNGLMAHLKRLTKLAFSPRFLFTTNVVVTTALLGAGDYLEQIRKRYWSDQNSDRNSSVDYGRVSRVAGTGALIGPMNHFWYKLLDGRFPGKTPQIVVLKILIDVLSYPPFACAFIASCAIFEGNSMKDALKEYREKAWQMMKVDLGIWPFVQAFNFVFLPPETRVLFLAVIQLVYNSIISNIKHDNNEDQQH